MIKLVTEDSRLFDVFVKVEVRSLTTAGANVNNVMEPGGNEYVKLAEALGKLAMATSRSEAAAFVCIASS